MPQSRAPHAYRALLSPGRIGSMTLKNRIIMSPMGDNQATADGYVTPQQMAYFEARARGGAAMLLMGSVGIAFPEGGISPFQVSIADDDHVTGLAQLAGRVHAHGCRIAAQLSHGGKTGARAIGGGVPMMVASLPKDAPADPVMGVLTSAEGRDMGWSVAGGGVARFHEMDGADIARVIDAYVRATERARRAGLDGVELHAGHGYLIDQFLSPTSNFRTDGYGGSTVNRARFLVEILAAVRARVGPDYPVWCRINGAELLTDEGETLEDALMVAELAARAGADALHVSAYAPAHLAVGYTEAHTTHVPGRFMSFGAAVKARVGIPVIAVGRIEPETAERLIADGTADFVAMGRKLLADPELPNKLTSGLSDDIRPCIYHYRCISQIFVGQAVRCAANPATGREGTPEGKPGQPRRVLVVGGGPAGMEAARQAAADGHQVVLADAGPELGGRLALAALTYQPHADLLSWLRRQIRRAPIEVRLNCAMTRQMIVREGADVVVLATGGRWTRPDLPGIDGQNVYGVDELGPFLRGSALGDLGRVAIIGGDRVGIALAQVAAARGIDVVVLEPSEVLCLEAGLPLRWRFLHDLDAAGVDLVRGARDIQVLEDAVTWATPDGSARISKTDAVFAVAPVKPDTALADDLRQDGLQVRPVGDCQALGSSLIEGALLGASEVVRTI